MPQQKIAEGQMDRFYEDMESAYDSCPANDIKIILRDFNTRLGNEDDGMMEVGNFSLHEKTSENGLRLLSFTAFQNKNIHKATWRSPDWKTENQVDHVLIDVHHCYNMFNVWSCRGDNADIYHYLVVKVHSRLSNKMKAKQQSNKKYDIEKLKDQVVVKQFECKISNKLQIGDCNEKWKTYQSIICKTAKELAKKNIWEEMTGSVMNVGW